MSSLISAIIAVQVGLPTPQDATPKFLPCVRIESPSIEEVTKHLEGQEDFKDFLRTYKNTLITQPLAPVDISDTLKHLASMPSLKVVENYSQQIIEKTKTVVLDKSHLVLVSLLPGEMYDYFVPNLRWIGESFLNSVRRVKALYQDALTEGGFLTRLEQNDFFSAGRLAHQRSQYYCQALFQEIKMSAFVNQSEDYPHLVQPISEGIEHFKKGYQKWYWRRVNLYDMSYTSLQASQMQVRLKLFYSLERDAEQKRDLIKRINTYEHWINATQVAFYNKTMEEKGLSYPEKVLNKTRDFLEATFVQFWLQETSEQPPPLS